MFGFHPGFFRGLPNGPYDGTGSLKRRLLFHTFTAISDPEGVIFDSPGRSPGFTKQLPSVALKGNAVKHFLRWFARFGAFFDREIFRTNNSNLANCVFSRTKN
ncbi:MAG TPA: hypothetical protein VFI31_24730, partial [Pirellulales bacterium]|nr:hypothetical protein [Pirellulales bacterium]